MKASVSKFISENWAKLEENNAYKISNKPGENGVLAYKAEFKVKAPLHRVNKLNNNKIVETITNQMKIDEQIDKFEIKRQISDKINLVYLLYVEELLL